MGCLPPKYRPLTDFIEIEKGVRQKDWLRQLPHFTKQYLSLAGIPVKPGDRVRAFANAKAKQLVLVCSGAKDIGFTVHARLRINAPSVINFMIKAKFPRQATRISKHCSDNGDGWLIQF